MHERKSAPADWTDRIRLRAKRGHREQDLDLFGDEGNEFRLILRQSTVNQFDFSIILAVRIPLSNQLFRLRRYNGRSHEHTNHLEEETFYDFHIHYATERYQNLGTREDAYAEPTDRYADYRSALRCFIEDSRLSVDADPQSEFVFGSGE